MKQDQKKWEMIKSFSKIQSNQKNEEIGFEFVETLKKSVHMFGLQ